MTTAITTSAHTTTFNEMVPNLEAKTVAQAISVVFQQALLKIPKDQIQNSDHLSAINVCFNMCQNTKSHPCFDSMKTLDIQNEEACIEFLMQVGKELTTMLKPTDFQYNIEVSDCQVSNEAKDFIKAYSLTIKCFGSHRYTPSKDRQPEVFRNCGVIANDLELFEKYKKNSNKQLVWKSTNPFEGD